MKSDADHLIDQVQTAGYAEGHNAFQQSLLVRLNELVPQAVQTIRDSDVKDVGEKVAKIIEQVPAGRQRKQLIHKLRRMLDRDLAGLDKEREIEREILKKNTTHLWSGVDATERILEWMGTAFKLQKPIETMVHLFREALADGRIFYLPARDGRVAADDVTAWDEMAASSSIFLVQHNWDEAFKNARDYVGGEIHLPDESCIFEFRISDRHVIAFVTEADGTLYFQHAVQVKKGWLLFPLSSSMDDELLNFTGAQIKAIAVALDAQVATTETIRAPHAMNRARERAGKLPLISYHIVNLSRRSRPVPLAPSDPEATYHVRLHFRRGHWRHFSNHKTWIRWMLVGDPDLGFVDKQYRL
jgi:hypothetical protein